MIEVSALSKYYGDLAAVRDLSFRVEAGEVLGFLGPNGAGKSTTMRMITGFIAPSAGHVVVCGHDVARAPLAARRQLGYLPEGAPAWSEMTARAFLVFMADVRGLRGSARARRLEETIARLSLGPVLDQSIETLSKGFRRRLGIAQAILHDPPVLILDEPTDGLDPNQKHELRAFIREMAPGKAIIISTHILEEVHAVCTRAIIIARGRLCADDRPAALEARSRYHNAVTLTLALPGDHRRVETALRAVPGVLDVETDASASRLTAIATPGAEPLAAISALAAREHWHLDGLRLEHGRLDEVFRTATAGAEAAA
jgi:ABC-2 type transport system ATP-binding protein